MDKARDIYGEAGVPTLVLRNERAVEIDLRVLLYSVEFEREDAAVKLWADGEMFAVPTPAIPPVRVVPLRRPLDERMHIPRRFERTPRVGNRDCRPLRIIVIRRSRSQVWLLVGKVLERPIAIDGFDDAYLRSSCDNQATCRKCT